MTKVAALIVVFVGLFMRGDAITCYVCSNTGPFQGGTASNDDCYDTLTGTGTSVTESTDQTTTNIYCFTTITTQNGQTRSISRGFTDGGSDSISTTTGVPTNPYCVTTFASSPFEQTVCTYTCTSSNCNTQTLSNLNSCSSNCSETVTQGYCDYLSNPSACVCTADFTGSNCHTAATKTYRSCVQCDSNIDSNCETSTTSTQCTLSETVDNVYCTSTKTSIITASGSVVQTRVVKGCAVKSFSQPHNQCEFADSLDTQFTGYKTYTCTSVCGSNGCNTAAPTPAATELNCIQCSATDGTCASKTTRSPCPTGSNQCYSKIIYLIANKTGHRITEDPDYQFVSMERGCRTSTTSVNQCTTTNIGTSGVQNVTCEESCTTAGCNFGWPNRTECTQCTTSTTDNADGYDGCVYNPPSPTTCPFPYQSYCGYIDTGKKGDLVLQKIQYSGFTRRIIRACTYHDIGNNCNVTTMNGVEFRECNKSCTTYGCNQGNGSGKLVQSLVMLSIPALLGYLLQRFVSN